MLAGEAVVGTQPETVALVMYLNSTLSLDTSHVQEGFGAILLD